MNNLLRSIYCDDCKKDIPVEELEDGSIVIHCPKCIGECTVCDCHLAKVCFSDAPGVRIQPPDNGKEGGL